MEVVFVGPNHVEAKLFPQHGEIDQVATYRLSAWDVGSLPLGLGDVTVRVNGVERRVPLAGYRVMVRSVLPADTTLRKPKPQRASICRFPSSRIAT